MAAELKESGWYGKGAWKRLRVQALNRDHWLCQECLRRGKITTAREVHHKLPLEEYPELGLELSNLESLCHECHEATKAPRSQAKPKPTPRGVRVIKI